MKFLAIIATLSLFGSAFALFDSPSPHLIIDAGHGGHDPGAIHEETTEAEVNLTWAMELKELAEERGMTVTVIRNDNSFLDLSSRRDLIDQVDEENSILISLHQNHSNNPSASGAFVYYSEETPEKSQTLARLIEIHLDSITDTRVQAQSLFLLRKLEIPGIIVSPGFLSNSNDLEKLNSAEFRSGFNHQLLNALQK